MLRDTQALTPQQTLADTASLIGDTGWPSAGGGGGGARQVMVWIQHTVVSVSGLGENETGSTQFIGFTWTRPAVSQSSHIYSVCLQSEWFEKYLCVELRLFSANSIDALK